MFLFREFTISEKTEIRASLVKSIYGVGWSKANKLANLLALSNPFFGNHLNYYLITNLLYLLKGLVISDARIKRVIENNINRKISNGSLQGARHSLCLSVRGQRTRTNSATQRKKRK